MVGQVRAMQARIPFIAQLCPNGQHSDLSDMTDGSQSCVRQYSLASVAQWFLIL